MAPDRYNYQPYSIKRAGGIKVHLDTRTELGYANFRMYREKGLSAADIARLFGKHRHTIEGWIAEDDQENGPVKAGQ